MVLGEKTAKKWYKATEDTAVKGYQAVEDKFVKTFFAKEGETVEEAKERLRAQKTKKP